MYNLVIKNGLVITPDLKSYIDIAVKDGKIAELAEPGKLNASHLSEAEIYNAEGKCIIPGLVEPHMHIKAPLGGFIDILDFDSASKCAAFGGVTTYIDFTSTLPGVPLLQAVQERKNEMEKSSLDYSCHCKVVNLVTSDLVSLETLAEIKYAQTKTIEDKAKLDESHAKVQKSIDDRLAEIPEIIKKEGIPTFKLFMTYRKANVMIDDIYLLKVLKTVKEHGGRCGFHAESNAIAEYNEEAFEQEGKLDWKYFPEYKPNLCEAEAVNRVLHYAELLKAPVYFFHISAKESVEYIRQAKKRGVDVIAETCSHYLMLTKRYYDNDDGILYLMSPPLRAEEDQKALWEALNDGTLSLVSSDNCTYTRKQKEQPLENGLQDFRKPISGVSGIEERFTLMRWAVEHKKITEQQFVKLVCENPAKIFGCYPQKGCLAVGSDADITIFDPNKTSRLTNTDLHYPKELDYSIYKEFEAKGKVVSTIRRGEFLVKDEVYNTKASHGLFLKRKGTFR
jgi:dihydropyrimidinase